MRDQPGSDLKPLGTLARLEALHPKDETYTCYVCSQPFISYRDMRVTPPFPDLVRTLAEVNATEVVTCGDGPCAAFEQRRRDALFNLVLQKQGFVWTSPSKDPKGAKS